MPDPGMGSLRGFLARLARTGNAGGGGGDSRVLFVSAEDVAASSKACDEEPRRVRCTGAVAFRRANWGIPSRPRAYLTFSASGKTFRSSSIPRKTTPKLAANFAVAASGVIAFPEATA